MRSRLVEADHADHANEQRLLPTCSLCHRDRCYLFWCVTPRRALSHDDCAKPRLPGTGGLHSVQCVAMSGCEE